MKQKLFSFFLTLLSSVSAIYASNTKVDGIWYDFDSSTKTASVTYRGSSDSSYEGEYSGSVTIPETVTYNGTTYSVTSIGDRAFASCSKLTSITLPNSVTSIGDYTFYKCSGLTSITIPNSVTSIDADAFYGCSYYVTSITLTANSVEEFCQGTGNFLLLNRGLSCDRKIQIDGKYIIEITIPNTVTGIGKHAFSHCSSLTSVTIPNSVTSIGSGAFQNCSKLTSITIPNSVTNIGTSVFSGRSVTINSEAIVNTAYSSSSNISHIFGSQVTEYIIGEDVKGIGHMAFYNCSSLTAVVIPNSVTSIAYGAFGNCSSLATITIPNGVTSIGDDAFYKCSGLTSITIGENVTSIGDDAFYGCSHLTSIVWNVKKWNDFSALNAPFNAIRSQITSFTFGESVQHIPAYLCYEMSKLTSITIGENVTSIGDKAFYYCSGLTSIVWNAKKCNDFSSSIKAPFYDFRSQIISFTFGESVQHIPAYLCYEMSKLTSITITKSVMSVGDDAFYKCSGLTSITIGENVTSIGDYAFYYCSGLTSITIPNSVMSIGDYAFYYCSGLKSTITIGESVTSIGKYAFAFCEGLTSITIGESVTNIEDYAFHYCPLTSINSLAEVPPFLGSTVFNNTSIPIYVPCGSVSVYESAESWKKMTNIQEPLAEHSYSIVINVNDNKMGTAQVDKNNFCGAQISATPNYGYHFVKWSDGNTDNPRILELTQDATFTAEFAQTYSGQCGDNLYWSFNNNTLTITGFGDMWDERPWGLFDAETRTILFPDGITSIGDNAFNGFINLTSITIPNSVEGIGSYAFKGCSGLTSITIPNSVTGIGASVFDDCSDLTSIVWNAKNCENYSYHPFKNIRSQITSFTIGDNVQYIPNDLCAGMNKLTSITIPNSVTEIGEKAFKSCSGLTSVTIGNSVWRIGDEAFMGCSSLTSVTIGSSVTHIKPWAFKDCSSLSTITIPNSVISIGYGTFDGCVSLGKVSLGYGIEVINEEAFAGCNRLYDIYCYATTPPEAEESSFANYNVNLYVPCESLKDYQMDMVFGSFKYIQCLEDTPPSEPQDTTITHTAEMVTICEGEAYKWHGYEYSQSGTYTYTETEETEEYIYHNVYTLELTVLPSETIEYVIEAEDSYEWHGVVYTESGTYTYRHECTTEILYLTIKDTPNTPDNPIIDTVITGLQYADAYFIADAEYGDYWVFDLYQDYDAYDYVYPAVYVMVNEAYSKNSLNGTYNVFYTEYYTDAESMISTDDEAEDFVGTLTIKHVKGTNYSFNGSFVVDGITYTYDQIVSVFAYEYSAEEETYYELTLSEIDSPETPDTPERVLSCEEAVALCLETGTTATTEEYTIRGYVTEITTEYSERYNNISFYMADTKDGGQVLFTYRIKPMFETDCAVKVGDFVEAVGTLVNYNGNSPEVYPGVYTIVNEPELPTGTSDIQLPTSNTKKVVKAGQLLIIRDGKTYTVMGTEIK